MCSTSWIVPVRRAAGIERARAIAGGKVVIAAVAPAAVPTARRKPRRLESVMGFLLGVVWVCVWCVGARRQTRRRRASIATTPRPPASSAQVCGSGTGAVTGAVVKLKSSIA